VDQDPTAGGSECDAALCVCFFCLERVTTMTDDKGFLGAYCSALVACTCG
jgi:hypothetical protein